MNVFFLDDSPERTKKFRSRFPMAVTAATVDEAKAALEGTSWDLACLDHDLGGDTMVSVAEYNTGTTLANWIVEQKIPIDKIVVHSLNPSAADLMTSIFRGNGYDALKIPFINLFRGNTP